MSRTKELFEEVQFEQVLGEEHRAYIHWIEQEQYSRYPRRYFDLNEMYE